MMYLYGPNKDSLLNTSLCDGMLKNGRHIYTQAHAWFLALHHRPHQISDTDTSGEARRAGTRGTSSRRDVSLIPNSFSRILYPQLIEAIKH